MCLTVALHCISHLCSNFTWRFLTRVYHKFCSRFLSSLSSFQFDPMPASEEIDLANRAQIYTDWANHYLEKAHNKRFISDLQQDVGDGVLLADVIEAVTNEKVKDIKLKPKTSAQMFLTLLPSFAMAAVYSLLLL
ncbi:neuron navigator 2-like isoform X1 [Octopus vulgaris]|uniref:Neuron navigator 2-like isoform X1 n=1 Tax=Octopus vulgaris TaxID=6645 RepID=A0AA36BPM3_OCTVU|nr:neuron navigator 2-like isoform X1 [Octopus vulgaris]